MRTDVQLYFWRVKMTQRKRPYLFTGGGSSTYIPPEPIQPPREEGAKPKLVGDTVSCRHEIGTVGGAKKYCPYERKAGSRFCDKHEK